MGRPTDVKIMAMPGSLQRRSSNSALIRAAQRVAPDDIDVSPFWALGDIPLLNPELDESTEGGPAPVAQLRSQVCGCDALLIASPEYGHSMPGVLKNALDWFVASGELSGLPIALMSASTTLTGGIRAQMALTQTLLAQAANVVATLTVPGVKSKLGENGELTHQPTTRRVKETLVALSEAVHERRQWLSE